MRYTIEQKAGLERLHQWYDTIASLDYSQYYKVTDSGTINASMKDCANWLANRMSSDTYDGHQQRILNTFRLIYLKNRKVKRYDELILDTSKL